MKVMLLLYLYVCDGMFINAAMISNIFLKSIFFSSNISVGPNSRKALKENKTKSYSYNRNSFIFFSTNHSRRIQYKYHVFATTLHNLLRNNNTQHENHFQNNNSRNDTSFIILTPHSYIYVCKYNSPVEMQWVSKMLLK